MQVINILKELFSHMSWADAKVWDTVLSLQDAEKDKKLKLMLYHYHVTKRAFYVIWKDLPLEFQELSEFENLQAIANWASTYPALIQPFLEDLKEEDLNRIIKIPWSDRLEKIIGKKPAAANLAETMIQVATHSSYHRGQVNSRIRELNGEPPLVDFIAWVWLGKPAAVWPTTGK